MGPRNHVLDGVEITMGRVIFGVVLPNETALGVSDLPQFTQQKISNGDSGTTGSQLQCCILVLCPQ